MMKNKKYLVFILIILGTFILSCGSGGDKNEQGAEEKKEEKKTEKKTTKK